MSGVKWDVKGVIHNDGTINPLPAESRVVTEIFQSMLIRKVISWGQKNAVKVDDHAEFGRGYPDVALSGTAIGSKLVALDVKSARVKEGDAISRMTLGTYDGYFLHPDARVLNGKTRSYNDYDEHWVIAVIYEWRPKLATKDMVNIKAICIGQKWQFAGRVSGSGDTANIGGITSVKRLQTLQSEFQSEEEFEKYWRMFARKHPRAGTKLPTETNTTLGVEG